jgi:anti-sigma regulatory factor (Ser/Thr protein kinase)
MQSHGRGLSMAKNIFDSMDFNQKGNQVTLTKFFPGG